MTRQAHCLALVTDAFGGVTQVDSTRELALSEFPLYISDMADESPVSAAALMAAARADPSFSSSSRMMVFLFLEPFLRPDGLPLCPGLNVMILYSATNQQEAVIRLAPDFRYSGFELCLGAVCTLAPGPSRVAVASRHFGSL